jgi:hypothetical protein
MLSPHRVERRRRLAVFALAAGGLVALVDTRAQSTSATPFGIEQLMQTLAQVKAGEASFTEVRTVTMLEHTLESSGRLRFEAPDTFVRETLKPRREQVAVVGNTVTMSLGARSRSVPLDSVPEAAVIMEAIRGTLTGNRDAIERHFSATVAGNAARWTLALVPLDARLREQVGSVRISGQQAALREMVVAMADGDRSVMTIAPIGPSKAASGPR